jgi:MSHA biogenesis protein MshG
VALVAAVWGFRMWVGTAKGLYQWDKFKLKIPVAGKIILKATLARFARSFSLSSRSGVPIVQALSVVAQTVDNAYLTARVEQMRDGVERGESILRTATATNVFTPIVLQMIAVGEESGSLDELMDEIAQMYEREVDYELKTLSSQIEPILIVFLGIMVLVLALGIFLPIWDLGKAALHH